MATILVVEDESLIRLGAVDMLKKSGHVTLEAANADEAIAILEARRDIEIVFSDVPGSMDGLRLMQVIRDRWPPIRLILTSGKGLSDQSAFPAGGIFLSKPYAPEDLARAIDRAT